MKELRILNREIQDKILMKMDEYGTKLLFYEY